MLDHLKSCMCRLAASFQIPQNSFAMVCKNELSLSGKQRRKDVWKIFFLLKPRMQCFDLVLKFSQVTFLLLCVSFLQHKISC